MISTLPKWQIQIQGWPSDLEHLALHFTMPPIRVARDEQNGGFIYESSAFSDCATSQEVLHVAEQELAVLSGVFKTARGAHEPFRSGAVYRQNEAGGRDVFAHIREGLQVRCEAGEVTMTITDSQGNVVNKPNPPPRTRLLAQLASSDVAVAKVMRLCVDKDSESWVGLYRIYEVVEADVGGQKAFASHGWGSINDLKRFKHSANSVTVAGDAARHGKESEQPPKQPMSLDEAAALIGYLVQAWLAWKGA
ncbi:MAG: hypothetical protein Q8K07_02225 [Methylicorpusculum sp.]|uniref:hypothetical protein n=1 Tax=Methylicorpusculum sp. TaxID=2713644 RepID=UPI002730A71F|nr:hypothetical protein [Methylicorpusculum sp.]MDP2200808.1 hypothetical protein [Methylicorpusculum sp.]